MVTRAIYVVPILAVALTAIVLLGPGAQRPAIGARVLGAPADGTTVLALRVEAIRHAFGAEDAAQGTELRVVAKHGDDVIGTWEGAAGPDGVVEARIAPSAPVRGRFSLRVERAGKAICEGDVALAPAPPAWVTLATLHGKTDGAIALRVDAERGVLAAPFSEMLHVSASPRARLDLAATGAELTPASIDADEAGNARVAIKPLAHDVDLTIRAKTADGATGSWQALLPIVPGAQWLAPESAVAEDASGASADLVLVSPAPRERAYVSLWSEAGRVGGAVVPLEKDDAGFFRGRARVGAPSHARLLFATVASDPREQGSATVAWPLVPKSGAAQARPLELLLDGMPLAIAREKERSAGARRMTTFVVAAAALLEALLVLVRARSSQRRLDEHLARAEGAGAIDASAHDRIAETRSSTLLWALVLIAVVALSFAIVGALATFRS